MEVNDGAEGPIRGISLDDRKRLIDKNRIMKIHQP